MAEGASKGDKYTIALLLGALLALPAGVWVTAARFWPDAHLMEPEGFYFGRDFLNYWTGGRLALLGQADIAYDVVRYNGVLRAWFAPEHSPMAFSYPPHALALLAPLAALPYVAAYVVWCFAGVVGFGAVALGRRPSADDRVLIAALALAPVLWVNVVFGQMGLLLALLFVGALRVLPTRPLLAGALMGVLTIKPQLGLLLPLVLLMGGAWRAIAAAVVTALALILVSLAWFGLEPWRLYVSETMPLQWGLVTRMDGFYVKQMITPYAAAWSLGAPTEVALALQAVVSTAIVATTIMVLRSAAAWPLKSAVVAFGSLLMLPYALAYDLAIPLAALVWYLREETARDDAGALALVGTLWALPYALTLVLQAYGLPLLPLVLIAAYAWLAGEALGWSRAGRLKAARAGMRASAP